MVAFVDHEVAVVRHAVVDDSLAHQALNHGDIEQPGWPVSPAADTADRSCGDVQERGKPVDPLIEQLPSMNEDESVHAALGNEPRGNDGLAEGSGSRQHSGVVPQHGVRGGLLFGTQLAAEGDLERAAGRAFISNGRAHAQGV